MWICLQLWTRTKQDCGVEKRNIPHDEWIMFGLPTWTAARRGAAQLSSTYVPPSTSAVRSEMLAERGEHVGDNVEERRP